MAGCGRSEPRGVGGADLPTAPSALASATSGPESELAAGSAADVDDDPASGEPRDRDDALLAALHDDAPSFVPVCSPRRALCVRAAPSADATSRALLVLEAAERALDVYTIMGLPAPWAGLDETFDLHVWPRAPRAGAVLAAERDVAAGLDRARAVGVVSPDVPWGCDAARDVAHVVARAIQVSVAPAMATSLAEASATTLALLATPCEAANPDELARAQVTPARSVLGGPPSPFAARTADDRRGALLFTWLDGRFGAGPGALVMGAWALAPSRTPWTSPRWRDDPTLLSVLAFTFRDARGGWEGWEELVARFAADRAVLGRAPVPSFRDVAPTASLFEAPLAWDVPFPEAPRRLVGPDPVAPLGLAVLRVRTAGAKPGARLRVEIDWEEHASFVWTALKIDAGGAYLGDVRLTSLRRGTAASRTLSDLDGVAVLLLVGTNVGDPAAPFDPDEGPGEPHGYLVTLAPE